MCVLALFFIGARLADADPPAAALVPLLPDPPRDDPHLLGAAPRLVAPHERGEGLHRARDQLQAVRLHVEPAPDLGPRPVCAPQDALCQLCHGPHHARKHPRGPRERHHGEPGASASSSPPSTRPSRRPLSLAETDSSLFPARPPLQIISYLSSRAHPQMRAHAGNDDKLLPTTVVDQIRLWEHERRRIQTTDGASLHLLPFSPSSTRRRARALTPPPSPRAPQGSCTTTFRRRTTTSSSSTMRARSAPSCLTSRARARCLSRPTGTCRSGASLCVSRALSLSPRGGGRARARRCPKGADLGSLCAQRVHQAAHGGGAAGGGGSSSSRSDGMSARTRRGGSEGRAVALARRLLLSTRCEVVL